MDRNSVNWSGPMPAVTTPFDDQGRIDERAFSDNIERLLAAGATGFVAGGCTGEFWALTHDERKRLADLAVAACRRPRHGDRRHRRRHRRRNGRAHQAAEAAGVDGALILPPYFVKLTDDEIFAHYRDVTARTGLPVLLYNIPGNAVNALTPQLVAPARRPRPRRRRQGELRRLEQLLRHLPRGARPAARLLRAVLGLRRAGGGARRRRHDRLLSQHVVARRARPLLRVARGEHGRAAELQAIGPQAHRSLHLRGPHALSRDQGGDGHDGLSRRRQARARRSARSKARRSRACAAGSNELQLI